MHIEMTSVKKNEPIDEYDALISPKWSGYHVIKICEGLNLSEINAKSIGVSHENEMGYLVELVADNGLHHVVQLSNAQFKSELNTSALMLNDSDLFFNKPVVSILSPDQAETSKDSDYILWEKEFTYKETKTRDLDELDEFLEPIIRQQSTRQSIRLIADELYTNAVYNAPLTKLGKQLLKILPFRKYNKPKSARLFIAKHDDRLIVGCEDQFGSLRVSALMKRVKSIYKKGVGSSIKYTSSTGAGIGTYMILQACTSYFAAVYEDKKTLVMGVIPLGMSSRKREELPKNIHLIQYKGG